MKKLILIFLLFASIIANSQTAQHGGRVRIGVTPETATIDSLLVIGQDRLVKHIKWSLLFDKIFGKIGVHTIDTNTQLSQAQVDAINLALGYVKGAHTVDTNTQLSNAQVLAITDPKYLLNTTDTLTGNFTATSFSGDGSQLTNVNATTLSGVDPASFLRSDIADTASGQITFNTGSFNPLKIDRTGSTNVNISFNHDGVLKGYLGVGASGNLSWGLNADSNVNDNLIHTGNLDTNNIALTDINNYFSLTQTFQQYITAPALLTGEVRTNNGAQLMLNAGESHTYATAQTNETIYANAESGLEVNASSDNWSTGWAGRVTTTIGAFGITWDGNTVWHGGNFGKTQIDALGINATLLNGETKAGILTSPSITGIGSFDNKLLIPHYIEHAGDTNTYIGFPSTDNFSVTTGGNTNFAVNVNSAYLKFKGTTKLITTTTGVDVTGALDVSLGGIFGGNVTVNNVASDTKIIFNRTGGNQFSLQHDSSNFYLYNNTTATSLLSFTNAGTATFGGILNANGSLISKGITNDNLGYSFIARNLASSALFSVRNDGRIDASGAVNVGSLGATGTATFGGDITVNSSSVAQLFLNSIANSDSAINFQQLGVQTTKVGYDHSDSQYKIIVGPGAFSNNTWTLTSSGNTTQLGSGSFSDTTVSFEDINLLRTNAWAYLTNRGVNGGIKLRTVDGVGTLVDMIEASAGGNYVKLNKNTDITGDLDVTLGATFGGNVNIGGQVGTRPLSVFKSSDGSLATFQSYTDVSNFHGLYISASQATNTVTLQSSGSSGGGFEWESGATPRMTLSDSGAFWVSGTGTFGGDVSLGDNNKALFGAGNDLQIYHNGTNSYIQDAGTGELRVLTNAFSLRNSLDTELMLTAAENGAVNLYYDNVKKLETTATGVGVTGIATATGLTLTDVGPVFTTNATNGGSGLRFNLIGATSASTAYRWQYNGTTIATLSGLGAIDFSSSVSATQLTSTIATGTAPIVVASTTPVDNLSVNYKNINVTTSLFGSGALSDASEDYEYSNFGTGITRNVPTGLTKSRWVLATSGQTVTLNPLTGVTITIIKNSATDDLVIGGGGNKASATLIKVGTDSYHLIK